MTAVGEAVLNRVYYVVCPHDDNCEFGCQTKNGRQVISIDRWEEIKGSDPLRRRFIAASYERFGRIETLAD